MGSKIKKNLFPNSRSKNVEIRLENWGKIRKSDKVACLISLQDCINPQPSALMILTKARVIHLQPPNYSWQISFLLRRFKVIKSKLGCGGLTSLQHELQLVFRSISNPLLWEFSLLTSSRWKMTSTETWRENWMSLAMEIFCQLCFCLPVHFPTILVRENTSPNPAFLWNLRNFSFCLGIRRFPSYAYLIYES